MSQTPADFWSSLSSVLAVPAVTTYLQERGVDPMSVHDADLARAIPGDGDAAGVELPWWAHHEQRSWFDSGHRLVVPVFGPDGAMRSLIARDVTDQNRLKGLAPMKFTRKSRVMADGLGRALLRGDADAALVGGCPRVVVVEGELDFLSAATEHYADESQVPAIFGVFSGAWTDEIASRVPDDAEVVIATDDDKAGHEYAARIAMSLGPRVALWRWSALPGGSDGLDVNDVGGTQAGALESMEAPSPPKPVEPPPPPPPAPVSSSSSALPRPAQYQRYVDAALDREIHELATAGQGGRNKRLNAAAFTLGTLIGAGVLLRSRAEQALLHACTRNGLWKDDGPNQCRATIRSGIEKGIRQPRRLPEPRRGMSDEDYRRIDTPSRAPSSAAAPVFADLAPPNDGAPMPAFEPLGPKEDAAPSEPGQGDVHPRERLEQILRGALDEVTAASISKHETRIAKELIEQLGTLEQPRERTSATAAMVLEQWEREGPVLHQKTGIDALDRATGGGFVYGGRHYLLGAPDAGKTALAVQMGHVFALRGVHVGFLAVDEEPADLLMRFAQRHGYTRRACEQRLAPTLQGIREELADLPLHFYDYTWTIESAARDLAKAAGEEGRSALFIDSVQTVKCDAELEGGRELGTVQAMEHRVHAIRAAASRFRMMLVATSEMSRSAYSGIERADPLAASKWSGAIEYSARIMLSLTSVPKSSDVVCVEVPKNKHGPQLREKHLNNAIYLQIERSQQRLTETERPHPDGDEFEPETPDEETERRRQVQFLKDASDAAKVSLELAKVPGQSARELRAELKKRCATNGLDFLRRADAIERRDGPRRRVDHFLIGGRVPESVLAHLSDDERSLVQTASPSPLTQEMFE